MPIQGPEITNLLSPWNIGITLAGITALGYSIRRAAFQASAETIASYEKRTTQLQKDLDDEKKRREGMERRLIALEADQAKAELRHRCDQGEMQRYQEIIRLSMRALSDTNEYKPLINEKMRELDAFQQTNREEIWALEETQRLFRTYKDTP